MKLPVIAPFKRTGPSEPAQPANAPLRTTAIRGNLAICEDGLWAWFALTEADWLFTSAGSRDQLRHALAVRFASLAGHRIHLRMTSQPLRTDEWARNLDEDSPNRLPDEPGAETWQHYLVAQQLQVDTERLEEAAVYLGVRVTEQKVVADQLEAIAGIRAIERDVAPVRKVLRTITESLRRSGTEAKPVTAVGLGWLYHASIALGAPVSSNALRVQGAAWDGHDLKSVTAPVRVVAAAYSPHVEVIARRDGHQHQHYATILTLGKIGERDTESTETWPWLSYPRHLAIPFELSAVLDVFSGESVRKAAEYFRSRAEHLADSYVDDERRPPAHIERAIGDAYRIEDEVVSGTREASARVYGTFYTALWANTAEDLEEVVAEFMDATSRDLRDEWVQAFGQWACARSFIPGEGAPDDGGYETMQPATFLAAGVPHASVQLGDNEGSYFARPVSFGRRPMFLDPTWGPRHNRSGVIFCVADVGAGKSTAEGALADDSARRGRRTVMFDPAGPAAALTRLPHLARHSRHIELASMADGVLSPGTMIPEPNRAEYESAVEWEAARREVAGERVELMVDSMLGLLPPAQVDGQLGVVSAVETACGAVGGEYGVNPWQVLDQLAHQGGWQRDIAESLRTAAGMRGGTLIFARRDCEPDVDFDAVLTVITMQGMVVPPRGVPRTAWSRAERMSVPLLRLASHLATRAMYLDLEPKLITSDEAGMNAAGNSSFASSLTRWSLETRKRNCAVVVAGQNPSHLTGISDEVANLAGMVMVGRITDQAVARAGLDLLGIPQGYGYERTFAGLESGQFVIRDWEHRFGVRQVDVSHRPQLAAALNTTPPALSAREDRDRLQFVEDVA
ncbi:ATP-binding protein [Angustibacter sp. McL0619]|uniref:ATP-binding protein n=1 Tax=Angustibacter sp. McL0619 TaxID=3415676 RepID=UPI003CF09FA9